MKIELNSRIGNCILTIAAEAECPAEIGKAAIKQMISHDTASEAYKKTSSFKRDDVFSDALAAHVMSIARAKITALGFINIVLSAIAYVPETEQSKFEKAMKGVGFDAAKIAELWAIAPQNPANAKPATPVAVPAEVSLS